MTADTPAAPDSTDRPATDRPATDRPDASDTTDRSGPCAEGSTSDPTAAPLRYAYGTAHRAHLHHPHLLCSDIDATIAFYRDWFDAEVRYDGPYAGTRNVFLKIGTGAMHLYEKPPRGQGAGAIHHLGMQVVGLKDLYGRMKAAGLCERSPMREIDGGGYFMVEAPDGVLLEVFEPGPGRDPAVLDYYGLSDRA